jgi:hypothetical protein
MNKAIDEIIMSHIKNSKSVTKAGKTAAEAINKLYPDADDYTPGQITSRYYNMLRNKPCNEALYNVRKTLEDIEEEAEVEKYLKEEEERTAITFEEEEEEEKAIENTVNEAEKGGSSLRHKVISLMGSNIDQVSDDTLIKMLNLFINT